MALKPALRSRRIKRRAQVFCLRKDFGKFWYIAIILGLVRFSNYQVLTTYKLH